MLEYKFRNFYEIIQNNAKIKPRKKALFHEKETLTNKQLKEKIDSTARFLENCDVKKGDKVALILQNCLEFVISFFAISRLGAIVVPINNFLKQEEFEYILNDCGAKIIISSVKFENETKGLLLSSNIEKIIWVEENKANEARENKILDEKNFRFTEALNFKDCEFKNKLPKLDDLACIIYTSGTTGKPKGAMLTHRNMLSNIVAVSQAIKVFPKDRFIVFLPMFHSFTLTIMVLLPFYFTSSLVIVKSVFPFSNVLKQTLFKRVSVFLGVPTLYNSLLKAKIPWYFMWFNKIRIFISGGSALSENAINKFNKKFKRAKLLEGYGLSECSPAVAINTLLLQKSLSVGPMLPGYEAKIVDDNLNELKTNEVGEIIIKGDCVMKGYLNRPDATEQTIVNGWLRTGDLGKLDEDNYLYIVDRKKDLIIAKGINIYPREIEEILYKYEGIDSVAVIGVLNDEHDEDVIAFITLKENVEKIPQSALKKFLKARLANYKIPKFIYTVEELPKNATGKVLKRVLKAEFLQKKKENKIEIY